MTNEKNNNQTLSHKDVLQKKREEQMRANLLRRKAQAKQRSSDNSLQSNDK